MFAFFIIQLALGLGLRTFDPASFPTTTAAGTDNATLTVSRNRALSSCKCDISDQCDENCCCDPDCPTAAFQNVSFDRCLAETVGIDDSERRALRFCNEPEIPGEGTLLDWFQRTMLCVYRTNNPSTGTFYNIDDARTTDAYIETESSIGFAFTVQDNIDTTLRPLITELIPQDVFTLTSTTINEFPLPVLGTGQCSANSSLLYLDSFVTSCQFNYDITTNAESTGIFTTPNFCTAGTDGLYTCNFPSEVTVSNANCTTTTTCTANAEITRTSTQTLNSANGTVLDIPLSVVVRWATAQTTQPTTPSRAYLFSDYLVDQNFQPIEISASSSSNFCNESSARLLFGANSDTTCLADPLTLLDATTIDTVLSSLPTTAPYAFTAVNVSQTPIAHTNNANNVVPITINPVEINTTVDGITAIYLSEVVRMIDVFYSTVGHTKSPQHILEAMTVTYNYSTIHQHAATSLYFQDVDYIRLRTVVKFYEYPNSINMNQGRGQYHKIQAWLPF